MKKRFNKYHISYKFLSAILVFAMIFCMIPMAVIEVVAEGTPDYMLKVNYDGSVAKKNSAFVQLFNGMEENKTYVFSFDYYIEAGGVMQGLLTDQGSGIMKTSSLAAGVQQSSSLEYTATADDVDLARYFGVRVIATATVGYFWNFKLVEKGTDTNLFVNANFAGGSLKGWYPDFAEVKSDISESGIFYVAVFDDSAWHKKGMLKLTTASTYETLTHKLDNPVNGTTYTLSCVYYMPASNETAGVMLRVFGDNAATKAQQAFVRGTYGTLSVSYTVNTATGNESCLYFGVDAGPNVGVTVYMWNFTLTASTSAQNILTDPDFGSLTFSSDWCWALQYWSNISGLNVKGNYSVLEREPVEKAVISGLSVAKTEYSFAGETVTFEATAENGKTPRIYTADNTRISGFGNYSFVMPEGGTTLNVQYVTPVIGDVNDDSVTDIRDLVRLKKAVACVTGDYWMLTANMADEDTVLDSLDIAVLRKKLLGFVDAPTEEENSAVINLGNWIEGSYVRTDGVFAPYGNWHRTDYIKIGDHDGVLYFTNTAAKSEVYNCFYDADYNQVGTHFDTNGTTITVPESAVYFVLSLESSYTVDVRKKPVEVPGIINLGAWVENSYVRTDGIFAPYGNWHRTDYIEIGEHNGYLYFENTAGISEPYNCFYDVDYNQVGTHFNTNGTTIAVPENAVYFVLSLESEYTVTVATEEAYLVRMKLPSYYTTSATEYAADSYIDKKLSSVPQNGNSFAFITDVHWPTNAQNSVELLEYATKKLGLDTVIHGGDIIDYNKDDPAGAAAIMSSWVDKSRVALGDKLLLVQGNHDINTGSGDSDADITNSIMSYQTVEELTLGSIRNTIVQESDEAIEAKIANIPFESEEDRQEVIAYFKMHYYRDDAANKTRYIVLVHGTHLNGIISKYFYVRQFGELFLQLDWLYGVLMSTPADYNVIVSSHTFINWSTNYVQSVPLSVTKMLSGLKTKTTQRIACGEQSNCGGLYNFGYHDYDFTSAPNVGKIICLGGDAHWDWAGVCRNVNGEFKSVEYTPDLVPQEDDILVIHTQTDAYKRTYPSGTYLGDTWEMKLGTVTEQCFDIITLTDTQVICTRIGAGEDRVFNYG